MPWIRPLDKLDETHVDRGLRMLLFDGVFGQAMLILSTGAFLVGYALELGASNKIIGLLAAVGPVAQALQIPAIFLVERLRLRKAIFVASAALSRVSLLLVGLLPWLLPDRWLIPAFLALLLLHTGLGAVAGCAFNSWIRDLVPVERMSRFFARRLGVATMAGAALSLLGGFAVDYVEATMATKMLAYAGLFGAASVFGIISVVFMARAPEPRMPAASHQPLGRTLSAPLRDRNYRNLVTFLGWWNFAVNFAAPFFAVYMLRRLGLSMTWVLGLSVLSQVFNVFFFGIWGRLAERFTNKSVLTLSVPLFFITFLMWPFLTMPEPHVLTIPLLITIHILSGISTAGVALCAGNLALKMAPYGGAAAYLAVNALIAGAAATVSSIVAGFTADFFAGYELQLTLAWLEWQSNTVQLTLPTIDLRGLDFIFVLAFVFGLYSVHRVLPIREQGEVTEQVLRQAFLGEMRRVVRQVSTIAGMRQMVISPLAFLIDRRRANRDAPTDQAR